MNKDLVKKVDERGQDNLIARLFPRALTTAVKVASGEGQLKRGTVLTREDDGRCKVMGTDGKPAYILADPVDATEADAVAVVYRSGNFNPSAIITKDGYTLSADDKDALRKYDIVFTNMMED